MSIFRALARASIQDKINVYGEEFDDLILSLRFVWFSSYLEDKPTAKAEYRDDDCIGVFF